MCAWIHFAKCSDAHCGSRTEGDQIDAERLVRLDMEIIRLEIGFRYHLYGQFRAAAGAAAFAAKLWEDER